MESEGWLGILLWTATIISFAVFTYLGIENDWDYWFLIAIGMQIPTWIIFFVLYGMGLDGSYFYFSTLFKNIGILIFLTLFFGILGLGFYALWIIPAGICLILFGKNQRSSHKPWSD